MLFSLGIGSNIGMASCIITVIRDRFPKIVCWKLVIAISIIGICVGSIYTTPGGQFLIIFLDFYGASFVAFFFAIIELLTVTWIYGLDRFCHDVEFMLGRKIGVYWRICWGIVTPLMMIGIFIYFILTWESLKYQDYEFHPKMHGRKHQKFNLSNELIKFFISIRMVHFNVLLTATSNLGNLCSNESKGKNSNETICCSLQAKFFLGSRSKRNK